MTAWKYTSYTHLFVDEVIVYFFFFIFLHLDGLGFLACSHSELINSEFINLVDSG
jgi:hypothetical protein